MIVNINDRGISIRRYIVYLTKGSPVANNDRAFYWQLKMKLMEWSLVFHLMGMALMMIAKEMEKPSNKMKK